MGRNVAKEKYCKFDLFTDRDTGLANIEEVAQSQSQTLIAAREDEDYETDAGVMRNTKRICERDLKETYLQIMNNRKKVETTTHNYKFQVALAKVSDKDVRNAIVKDKDSVDRDHTCCDSLDSFGILDNDMTTSSYFTGQTKFDNTGGVFKEITNCFNGTGTQCEKLSSLQASPKDVRNSCPANTTMTAKLQKVCQNAIQGSQDMAKVE